MNALYIQSGIFMYKLTSDETFQNHTHLPTEDVHIFQSFNLLVQSILLILLEDFYLQKGSVPASDQEINCSLFGRQLTLSGG